MSSRTSYSSSTGQDKVGNAARPSSRSSTSTSSSAATQSIYANSAQSSRNYRYGSKPAPVTVHNGGGQSNDPNTSTSAPNSGYY
ncbi:hypothetical protein K491DRAFT_694581, partial [Lophiostoma macrostomum CBS 122681]